MRQTVVVSNIGDPDGGEHQVVDVSRTRAAAHSVRPRNHTLRLAAAGAGFAAIATAIGLGTPALLRSSEPAPAAAAITTANRITVTLPPAAIPLSGAQIAGLLDDTPDFGTLSDAARRASCLTGLGYRATAPVLGATPVLINNRRGVVLVLEGDTAGTLTALAVAPNCSSAGTGLLAATAVARP
jgi:hypothetical protein